MTCARPCAMVAKITMEMKMTNEELGAAIRALVCETTIAKTKTLSIPLADMPFAAIEAFVRYGVQRKFNDAVGGATRGDEVYTPSMKVADAEAMLEDYRKGVVSKRREGGASVPDEVRIGRKVLRGQLSADVRKKLSALSADEQAAKLDAALEKNKGNAALMKLIDDEVKAERAKKVAAAMLGNAVTVDL